MPIYDYCCTSCGYKEEILDSFKAPKIKLKTIFNM